MAHQRLAYDRLAYTDADPARMMRHDARCAEVSILLRTSGAPAAAERPDTHDKVKAEISVDEAAYRLASALHLHLD